MTLSNASLPCHLLCAAECTYGIQPNQPFAKRQPYYDNIGFLADPTIITGGLMPLMRLWLASILMGSS